MAYKILYIFIEGNDDKTFFERIIKPVLEEKYDFVTLWKYAEKKKEEIHNFLKSIEKVGDEYIYLADINKTPCVTAKKQKEQKKFKLDEDKIVVVIKEIESWYLAGLDETSSKKLGISAFDTTDNIAKEQFNALIPKKFDSRIDFMSEIIKSFSVETAKQKNKSFGYFIKKHIG